MALTKPALGLRVNWTIITGARNRLSLVLAKGQWRRVLSRRPHLPGRRNLGSLEMMLGPVKFWNGRGRRKGAQKRLHPRAPLWEAHTWLCRILGKEPRNWGRGWRCSDWVQNWVKTNGRKGVFASPGQRWPRPTLNANRRAHLRTDPPRLKGD